MSEYNRYLPEEERQKAQKEKFVFADISDIQEEMAQDASLAQFNEKPESETPKGWKKVFSGQFWKGLGRSIWKQNLARDYYEVAGKKKAEKQMEEIGSLFAMEKKFNAQEKGISDEEKNRRLELQKQAHAEYTGAITKRFGNATGELVEDFVHTEHGEKIDTLGESEQEKLIKYKLIGTAKAFAAGYIDEQGVLEEEAKIWAEIKGVKPEVIQKGKMYASNLLKIAKMAKAEVERQVAQSIDQQQAVMNLNLDFDVVVARAKSGAKTEAQFNSVESAVEKIQAKTRGLFGFAFNETAITAVVTAAYYVKKSLFTKGMTSVAGIAGAAVGAGATAAFREGKVLEKERMQHAREMAQGRKFNESTATRRNELEQFRIKFKTARELENNLKASLFDWVDSGRDITELSLEEYEKAMAAVAEIDSRILEGERGIVVKKRKWIKFWKKEYSEERKKADLIGWSDPTKIAEEEGRLDQARAAAKMLLKKWALKHGKTEEQFKADVKSAVEEKVAGFYEGEEGIEKQNERFKKFKHKKMWVAGKRAAKWATIFGVAIQEASAFGQEHTYGALEHGVDAMRGQHHTFAPGEHATMLDSAFRHASKAGGEAYDYLFPTAHAAPAPKDYMLGGTKYKMYEGLHWQDDPSTPDPNDRILLDDSGNRLSEPGHPLKFNPDGTPSADAKKWLTDHGYNVKESLVPGAAGPKGIHNLDVAQTKAQYPDLQVNKRADWHDELGKFWSSVHKKMLEFEGKQQMGYLVAKGDKVYLDCSKVMQNFLKEVEERVNSSDFGRVEGYFNADGTPFVDPKMMHLKEQIVESMRQFHATGDPTEFSKHFQAVVIPTEGANAKGWSDLMGHPDAQGLIELKGKYDWSKLFVDPATGKIDPSKLHDGKLPFRFLEMRVDYGDGGHVMNTAQGAGETVATQTPVFEIIPPSGTGPEGLPPTVFPPLAYVGRRKGLENPERMFYYLSPSGARDDARLEQIFKENRSDSLVKNPEAHLDPPSEIKKYLERQDRNHAAHIMELSQRIEAVGQNCRLSVCIPVAAHQEGANIYNSLQSYSKQTANKDSYEIVLYANHPEYDIQGNRVVPDNTLEEIERFKRDHPDMNIRVVYDVLPREHANIGYVRKALNDLVLLRQHNRGPGAPDLIMVSNDADNKGIAPEYIQNFINKFDRHPEIDGMLGQLDWDPEAYTKNPEVHIGTRLFQYLNAIGRHRSGGLSSSGANFAFRASIYAGVGGYMNNLQGGEDINLGRAIIAARGNRRALAFAGARVSRVYTSARRAVYAWKKEGLPPVQQWDMGFSPFDEEVRKLGLGSGKVDYKDPAVIAVLKRNLEKVINDTLDSYDGEEGLGKGAEYYKKAVEFLGIHYDLDDRGNIVITNMDRVVRQLSEYQEYALLQRQMKSGDQEASKQFKEIRKKQVEEKSKLQAAIETKIAQDLAKIKDQVLVQDVLITDAPSSESWVEGANVVLDFEKEAKNYIEVQAPDYKAQLEKFSKQIKDGMDPKTKIAVCIPVAGHQEGENIYDTLKAYSSQTLPSENFELLVMVNTPLRYIDSQKDEIQKTLNAIARAKLDFPSLRIRDFNVVLPDDQVRIGNIRKIVTDMAVFRSRKADLDHDLLLLSNDSDNRGISSTYLQAYLDYFERNPQKEGAVGNLQFDPNAFVRFPLVQLQQEYATYLDQTGFANGNVDLFGSNSVMKSSIYCGIGGYPSALRTGEQEWTGNRIRSLRKSKETLGFVPAALLTTSSRRGIASLLANSDNQVAFGDEAAEAKMRSYEMEAFPFFDFSDNGAVSQLKTQMEQAINKAINSYEAGEHLGKSAAYYRDNLEKVGISYEVVGDPDGPESSISITDMSRFIERQRIMQTVIQAGEKNMTKVYEFSLGTLASVAGRGILRTPATSNLSEANRAPVNGTTASIENTTPPLLSRAEANRLIADSRLQFEADPYKFIYSEEGLNAVDKPGVGINRFMNEIKNRYGITDGEFAQVKQNAKEMRGTITGRKKEVAQFLRLIMNKDRGLRRDWMSSGDAGSYERLVKDLIKSESRESIDRKNFPVGRIGALADEFELEPAFILEAVMSARPQLERRAKREFNAAVRQGNYTDTAANRARVYREILEEYQNGTIRLGTASKRKPGSRVRPRRR